MGNSHGRSSKGQLEIEPEPDPATAEQIDSFQIVVRELLEDLSSAHSDELLSIPWLQKVINALSKCLDHFMLIIRDNKLKLVEGDWSALKEITTDYLNTIVIALDLLNAIRDGIHTLVRWNNLELKNAASTLGKTQYGRAKTATASDRISKSTEEVFHSVLRTDWSASKKLQLMENKHIALASSRRHIGGLAKTVFTMSFVVFHVMWLLVAAIPCQGRRRPNVRSTIELHSFEWGDSVASLRNRIVELDSTAGANCSRIMLLKEMHDIEKRWQRVTSLIDSARSDERRRELVHAADDLDSISKSLKEGLGYLEFQVRGVFRKIMSCKTEIEGYTDDCSA